MERKQKYMLDWRTLSKDREEILISDKDNENESNDEDGASDNRSNTF